MTDCMIHSVRFTCVLDTNVIYHLESSKGITFEPSVLDADVDDLLEVRQVFDGSVVIALAHGFSNPLRIRGFLFIDSKLETRLLKVSAPSNDPSEMTRFPNSLYTLR